MRRPVPLRDGLHLLQDGPKSKRTRRCKEEEPAMFNNSTFFIGLDLGDKQSHIFVLDPKGEVIEESRLPTNPTSLQRKFASFPRSRVAMEVGAHSRWASQLLKDLGHEVLVANARKLRAIYSNPRKGDRADAETLARLARLDPTLLSSIHHPPPPPPAPPPPPPPPPPFF